MLGPKEIAILLEEGEGPDAEFKLSLPPDDLVARTLVAFANSKGGTLLLGVDGRGKPVGLSSSEEEEALSRLQRLTKGLLPYPVAIDSIGVGGRSLVYVSVPEGPAHLKPVTTSRGEVYVREGARDVPAIGSRPRKRPRALRRAGRRVAFVAMSFREEEEPHLVDYFDAMGRAMREAKLPIDLDRIDLRPGDYEISQEIMNRIDAADIVIADFTLSPSNVYFELGYARGRGKQFVQTARQGTLLEFDVRNWRTMFYRNSRELQSKLRDELIVRLSGSERRRFRCTTSWYGRWGQNRDGKNWTMAGRSRDVRGDEAR